MEVKQLSKEKNNISFLVKATSPFFVNTLRRIMIEEVPTMAIEDVEFRDNSSALYDEIIAHRLGLLPLTTDLKSYNLPEECTCKGEGCAKCQLKLIFNARGAGYVYASDLKSKDPQVKPAYPKMPIAKLLKGQKIQFEATAQLGRGKEHVKWSPCLAWYKGWPEFKTTKKSDLRSCVEHCPLLELRGNTLKIKDILAWNEAYEEMCEKNNVGISYSKTDFIFNIESWGQLAPREIVKEAVKIFVQKLDDFSKQLTKK